MEILQMSDGRCMCPSVGVASFSLDIARLKFWTPASKGSLSRRVGRGTYGPEASVHRNVQSLHIVVDLYPALKRFA